MRHWKMEKDHRESDPYLKGKYGLQTKIMNEFVCGILLHANV